MPFGDLDFPQGASNDRHQKPKQRPSTSFREEILGVICFNDAIYAPTSRGKNAFDYLSFLAYRPDFSLDCAVLLLAPRNLTVSFSKPKDFSCDFFVCSNRVFWEYTGHNVAVINYRTYSSNSSGCPSINAVLIFCRVLPVDNSNLYE